MGFAAGADTATIPPQQQAPNVGRNARTARRMRILKEKNELVVRHPKAGLISYFAEMLAYTVGLILVCFVIWKSSETRPSIRIILIAILGFAYIIITIRQKKLRTSGFKIQLDNNEILIDGQHTGFDKINSISLKTSVSTYSANAYYDIYIKIGNTKYHLLNGVNEKDMNSIVNALNEFNGSEIKIVDKEI